jgi:hypothetical protein
MVKSRNKKYQSRYVSDNLTTCNADFIVAEQVHINHNLMQEIHTGWHCSEGKDHHVSCPDFNVHGHAQHNEAAQSRHTKYELTKRNWKAHQSTNQIIQAHRNVHFFLRVGNTIKQKTKLWTQQENKFYNSSKCNCNVWDANQFMQT